MAVLSLDSSGPEVYELQEKLIQLGFLSSDASGDFDETTETAVKQFQTQRPWLLTDGVVEQTTLGEIDDSISVRDGNAALQAFAAGSNALEMKSLRKDSQLSLAIQRRLRGFGLYPGGQLIDGDFGSRSQAALRDFCAYVGLTVPTPLQLTPTIADQLLSTRQIPSVLNKAQDSSLISTLFNDFQKLVGASDDKMGFLDMGVQHSPFKETLYRSPEFLATTPSAGVQSRSPESLSFSDYPKIGKQPTIDTIGLEFLESDITEACLCLGSFDGKQLTTSWLGRRPFNLVECWSSTKIIPILNVLCKLGKRVPEQASDLMLKDTVNTEQQFELLSAFVDICAYRGETQRSNALSATLNAFESNREQWIKSQTGNAGEIQFGGRYGAAPTIEVPEIFDRSKDKEILSCRSKVAGGNSISVYDLTRLMSLVGWHRLLSKPQRLTNISNSGLEQAIIALGTDTARYMDAAISTLGLENVVDSMVVLSKLGFGPSQTRNVTEIVYTTFTQFTDNQNPSQPKLRSFALTLRSSQPSGRDVAIQVDTTIATAVTEIVRRIVTEDFAG